MAIARRYCWGILMKDNSEDAENCMSSVKRQLLSGDEAIALAARDAGVALGAGYPGW